MLACSRERRVEFLKNDLEFLLNPQSVAVVGASDRSSHSRLALENLVRYAPLGGVFPVNPTRTSVQGLACYPTLSAIPDPVDLALIVVAQSRVMQVLEDCVEVGVHAAIVIGDGYRETGTTAGISSQHALEVFAAQSGMIICGPNCLGITRTGPTVAPFCGPISTPVLEGGLAIISQSGGVACAFMQAVYERHLGVRYIISSGNESCLDLCDYLDYVLEDELVTSMCLFIESIPKPLRFLESCARAASLEKPIVAIKVGESENGRLAALAHTGSIAGPGEAVAAVLSRGGVLRAADIDEALDLCGIFGALPGELWPKGPRVGVLTKGGGPAGLIADLAESHGIELPVLPPQLAADVSSTAPESVTVKNPLDFPGTYLETAATLPADFAMACGRSANFDAIVLSTLLTENALRSMRDVGEAQRAVAKPTLLTTPAITPLPKWAHDFSDTTGLHIITGVGRCIKAISAVDRWRKSLHTAASPFPPSLKDGIENLRHRHLSGKWQSDGRKSGGVIGPEEAARLLTTYGLPLVPQRFVRSVAEALAAADEIGYPVVLKAASADVPHKTEMGLVDVGIVDVIDLERRFAALEARAAKVGREGIAFVLQRAISDGLEMFIGVQTYKQGYPPTITVGPGGTAVETYGDAVTHLLPLTLDEAKEMVGSLRIATQLNEFRGREPLDTGRLYEAIVRLGCLAWEYRSDITAIDLNPVFVRPSGHGAVIVDYLVVASRNTASKCELNNDVGSLEGGSDDV